MKNALPSVLLKTTLANFSLSFKVILELIKSSISFCVSRFNLYSKTSKSLQ